MYAATTATQKILALKARIRAVQGGTSASKTVSILLTLISYAQSAGNKSLPNAPQTPVLISVVSESLPHLKKGAIRDFLSILETQRIYKEDRWSKTDFTYTFETGSKIEFFSVDQPDKVRGPRRDILFINECNNVSLETFEQLEIRTNIFVFLDWNPVSEFWFYTDVKPMRKDVEHITLTYKDNEALPKEIVASLEQRMNRKNWWKVYGEGQLAEIEGKIYNNWRIIPDIPHEARLEGYGLDFGYTNDPTAVIALYYYNGGYIFDELVYQMGMSNRDIANFFKTQQKKLVIADSSEPKSIEEIRMHGLNVVGVKKRSNVGYSGNKMTFLRWSIAKVQDQQISVTSRSVNLLKEYRNYLWAVDRNGMIVRPEEPEGGNEHLLDACRYALISFASKNDRLETLGRLVSRPRERHNIAV